MYPDTSQRKSPPPIVFIILGLIAFGGYKFIPGLFPGKSSETSGALGNRISLGNQILVASQTTAAKQAGVQAFAERNYQAAAESFEKSLQQNRNDPETL